MLKLKQPDPDEVVEKTNGLNAPLMPDLPASDEMGFRPLTDDEKKEFVGSLDAKGHRILAELKSPKPVGLETTEAGSQKGQST